MTATEPFPAPADETPPGGKKPASPLRTVVEWVAIVVAALVAAFLVKAFLFQPFYIPSRSMDPTLRVDDRLLVNKLSYRLHDVNRGDIVVFGRPPGQTPTPTNKDLVKRVVALGGETVEGRDGAVFVDGVRLDEPYLAPGITTAPFPPTTVEAGKVWVMGDNRGDSQDSRVFGAVDEDLIVGRAFIRFWPLRDLSRL